MLSALLDQLHFLTLVSFILFKVLNSFLLAAFFSSRGSGSVCGECVGLESLRLEKAPPGGGSVAVMWRVRDEGVAPTVPTPREPQTTLVPLAPHHALFPP